MMMSETGDIHKNDQATMEKICDIFQHWTRILQFSER